MWTTLFLPDDMFFSASSSAKLSEEANTRTSAILSSRCRKERDTSSGIPWVGSSTSTSLLGDVALARSGSRPCRRDREVV